MALSPYIERNSSVYRSRSSSVSSPTSRNFLYQEVFEIGGNALVRSFSCGQVFTKDEISGQTIQATQVRISNFMSPSKNLAKLNAENNGKSWTVPKKLPNNCHAEKKPVKSKMSLQFAESEKPTETAADGDKTTPGQFSNLIWRNMKRSVYINLVLTIFTAYYIYMYKFCNQNWDTQLIVNNLKESVFGQEEAISNIEAVLIGFNNKPDNAVLYFTGSIGVGKTYVSTIIYSNFPWTPNEYINIFDSKTEEILRNKKYSLCGINLIVIDGIDSSDADKAVKGVENLLNTQKAKFLVILIFRTRTTDEEKIVMESMKYTKQNFYYIPFKDLKEEEIEQCFITELKRQKKFITKKKMKELLTEQMKFCNISRSFHGCKNVFHEVSLLPESV